MDNKFKLISQKNFNPLESVCSYLKYENCQQMNSYITNDDHTLATSQSEFKYKKLKPIKKKNQLDFNLFDKTSYKNKNQKIDENQKKQKTIRGLSKDIDFKLIDNDIQQHNWELGCNTQETFRNHYKNLNHIIKQNQVASSQNSALTQMMIKQESYRQLPSQLNIVKKTPVERTFNLSNLNYGDRYIDAFSDGQQLLSDVDKFLLNNNRITEKSSNQLIQFMNPKILVLNLSYNNIGQKGCEQLSNYFKKQSTIIEELYLEQNNLNDQEIDCLIDGILKNNTLRILNFSQNEITSNISEKLSQLFQLPLLNEIYLYWNKIKDSACIFRNLINNKSLKVLDLSQNQIQGDQTYFLEFLINNKFMIHLDLSYNKFTYNESQLISEALNKNFTLIGFHFQGNYGYLDNQGFLIIKDNKKNFQKPQKRRIKGYKSLNSYKNKKTLVNINNLKTDDVEQIQDICWICDDWRWNDFKWSDMSSNKDCEQNDLVFLNLSILNYKSLWMDKITIDNDFKLSCMVPYKKCYYSFIVNNIPQIAQNQTKYPLKIRINDIFAAKKKINIKLDYRNYVDFKEEEQHLFNEDYIQLKDYKIRQQISKEYTYKKIRTKKKWNVRKSNFQDIIQQKDEIFEKFLDFDFSNTKIDRICKSNEDLILIKSQLKPIYKQIVFMYKYYSSFQPVGDVWAITINAFWQMINDIEIKNEKFIEADVFLKWQGTISGNPKGNPRTPDRGLVRHQLLEVLVRMAEQRYLKQGQGKSLNEAVQILITQNLAPQFYRFEFINWKYQRLLNYQCDKVVTYYKNIIKDLFILFSKKKTITALKPFVSLEELMEICKNTNLFQKEQQFTEKEVYFAFNLSKNIETDEINNNQTQQLYKSEFIEALGRIADFISLPMIGDPISEGQTFQERKSLALCIKLESLLNILIPICTEDVQKYFKKSEKSMFLQNGPDYITTVTEED